MKKLVFILIASMAVTLLSAQTNAEVVGKTITDSIQIVDGATMGHILQSANAQGLGKWVSPSTVMDNLGDHTATMDLNMNGYQIEKLDSVQFMNAQIIDPATAGTLKFNSHIDLQCNNLDNVKMINFCPTGSPYPISSFSLFPPGAPGLPDELILMNAPAAPPAAVALGVGGPVNPLPAPPIANVVANGGPPPLPLPYFNFGVWGDSWAFNWWALSDARFKKDIKIFDGALSKIGQLKPVTYQMNKEKFPNRKFADGSTYGFLAQDLLEVVPELVRMNSEGYYLVQYNGLIPILAEGIQELDEKTGDVQQELRAEIADLKTKNESLQNRLERLEKLVMNK